MSKKIARAQQLNQIMPALRCPICQDRMSLQGESSVICSHKHTFDLTKHGYVNFVHKPVKANYTKQLFAARREILSLGFYDPLVRAISECIRDHAASLPQEEIMLLDSGCGEGSHLVNITRYIAQHPDLTGRSLHSIGVDISKEAILAASKYHESGNWFVADLARSPFADHSFNVILNILSPANYDEFDRLLQNDGIVLKVVPGRDYLKELRGTLFSEQSKQDYSNQRTVDYFLEHYHTVKRKAIRYTRQVEKPLLPLFVQMTPMSWSSPKEQIQQFIQQRFLDMTFDLELLVGIHPKGNTKSSDSCIF